MNTANENPDRYDIQAEATHILEGLRFAEEHPEPIEETFASVKRRLRMTLAACYGLQWRNCTVERHTMPDGITSVYVAARLCLHCGTIHTYIAQIMSDGSFDFAAPAEE